MLANITEQNRLFSKFLRPVAIILIFMSLQRGFYEVMAGLNSIKPLTIAEHVAVYFMGLRFDLLVWGFVLIPLNLLALIPLKKKARAMQIYLTLAWVVISVINLLNLPFFSMYQKHLNWPEWQMYNMFEAFSEWLMGEGLIFKVLSLIFILFTLILGVFELGQAQEACNQRRDLRSNSISSHKELLKFTVFILIVAFCARGKLGQHHLRREDSQITTNSSWNELILNATWSFNKDDR